MTRRLALIVPVLALLALPARAAGPLKVGVFAVDASPPVGSPLAYDPTKGVETPLTCKGVVLIGEGQPVVLCAIDWIGVGNEAYAFFRSALAEGAGTTSERVALHALHQHDAPHADLTAGHMLAQKGIDREIFDERLVRDVMARASAAARKATAEARPVTHLGLGQAEVKEVASNRRILGPDGKVRAVRYTATKDPALRAEPEGTIDPMLKLVTLWDGDTPVVALSYYATHPQSYYRTGLANADFPGLAREARQKATGAPHIHFNGAGGNLGAGKYNDGSHAMRQVLADRLANGMARAWDATTKAPLTAADLGWKVERVALPVAPHLDEATLRSVLRDETASVRARAQAANDLAWLLRCKRGDRIEVSCLTLGDARLLHLPGELFVEYQLAAQRMAPDRFVAMAAYGDYAPGYIGTERAYAEGGYETAPTSSLVAPGVEKVLMDAIQTLLKD
jgi:hypothetical protein